MTTHGVTKDYGRWQLPRNLEELSTGGAYPNILNEWELDHVEHLAPGKESETCLCTHHPIRQVCHIRNTENNETAIVGNCCVKKFEKEDEGLAHFKGTHKVFACLKRLYADPVASANKELLKYAVNKGVITRKEYTVYSEIRRNRTVTPDENKLILRANEKIINHASSPAMREQLAQQASEARATRKQEAAARKQEAEKRKAELPKPTPVLPKPSFIALPHHFDSQSSVFSTPEVPKRSFNQFLDDLRAYQDRPGNVQLVKEAYSRQVLNEDEYKFYMKMVEANGKIGRSPKQQNWLSSLNKKILQQFQQRVSAPMASQTLTPSVKLVDRAVVINAFDNGMIKDRDREFYIGLIDKRVTKLSDKQKSWVQDIHKRLRVEDELTEANTNNRPFKRFCLE